MTAVAVGSIRLGEAESLSRPARRSKKRKVSTRSRLAEGQLIKKEFLSGSVHRTLPGGTYLIYRFDKSFSVSFDDSFDERFDESFDESFDERFDGSFDESYKFLI